jgi:hypothetical protein
VSQHLKAIANALQSHLSPPRDGSDRMNYDDFCIVHTFVKDTVTPFASQFFTATNFMKVCESLCESQRCLPSFVPALPFLYSSPSLALILCFLSFVCPVPSFALNARACPRTLGRCVRFQSCRALACCGSQFQRDEYDRISSKGFFQYVCGTVGIQLTRLHLRYVATALLLHARARRCIALCPPVLLIMMLLYLYHAKDWVPCCSTCDVHPQLVRHGRRRVSARV